METSNHVLITAYKQGSVQYGPYVGPAKKYHPFPDFIRNSEIIYAITSSKIIKKYGQMGTLTIWSRETLH